MLQLFVLSLSLSHSPSRIRCPVIHCMPLSLSSCLCTGYKAYSALFLTHCSRMYSPSRTAHTLCQNSPSNETPLPLLYGIFYNPYSRERTVRGIYQPHSHICDSGLPCIPTIQSGSDHIVCKENIFFHCSFCPCRFLTGTADRKIPQCFHYRAVIDGCPADTAYNTDHCPHDRFLQDTRDQYYRTREK